jgi:serine/threonine protein kinase
MPNAVTHPTPQQLTAFGLGKLSEAAAATVAAHLESCPACRQVAAKAAPSPIADQARAAKPGSSSTPPRSSVTRVQGVAAGAAAPEPAASPGNVPPELANHPKYRIIQELGRGGMGVVYEAVQTLMDRPVAIKVLNPSILEHPDTLPRFLAEVRAAAKLDHPNIVRAYDADQVGNLHLLVMEFVEGMSLADRVRQRGPVPVPHACHYARQAALGLQHAFERGMVHRDIKPQNLMLTPRGQVKVLDFGLARLRGEAAPGTGLTQVGSFMGTPEFVAPEQATDARMADTRADLYSLGCTLYFLLTGRPPFTESTAVLQVLAHIEKEPPALHTVRPDVPTELSAVVARMLAKDPAQRYQKPAEVAQALLPFIKAAAKATPPAPTATGAPSPKPSPAGGPSQVEWNTITQTPARAPVAGEVATRPAARKPWLIGAVVATGVLLGLVGLWAAGVFKVKTKDGILVVEVNEPNADVYVDGEKLTLTWDDGGKRAEIHVQPGTRKVEVKKDGFTAVGQELAFKEGGREVFTARLVSEKRLAASEPPPEPAKPDVDTTNADDRLGKGRSGRPRRRHGAGGLGTPSESPDAVQTKPPEEPPAPPVPTDGFEALFDGRTLAGWRTHPRQPGDWRVENGMLVGSGPALSYLYTVRDDFQDVHVRVEARISDRGNSGVFVRAPFGPSLPANNPVLPLGYEAQINSTHRDARKTGSLFAGPDGAVVKVLRTAVPPGEWFALEVLAQGNRIMVKVNGETTADYTDSKRLFGRGCIALQQQDSATVAEFRRIEVKELAPVEAAPAPNVSRTDPSFETFTGVIKQEHEVYNASMRRAEATLLAAFDRQLHTLAGSQTSPENRLKMIETVKAERVAFEARGRIPWSAGLRGATQDYLKAVAASRQRLTQAFDNVIDQYLKRQNDDKAKVFSDEKRQALQAKVLAVWNYTWAPGKTSRMEFLSNGNVAGGPVTWRLAKDVVILVRPDRAVKGGRWIDTCRCSADGKTMAGKNQLGHAKSGRLVDGP